MPQQRSWFDQFNAPTLPPIRTPSVPSTSSWFEQFNKPTEPKFDSQAFLDSMAIPYDPNAPEEKPYNPAEHGYFRNALQRVIDIPTSLWEMSPAGQNEKTYRELGRQKYLREHDPAALAARQAEQDKEFSDQLESYKSPWGVAKGAASLLDPTGAIPGYMGIAEQSVQDIKDQNWGGLTTNAALLATPWAFGKYLSSRGIKPGLLPEEPKVNVVPPVEPINPHQSAFDAANLGDRGSGPDLYNPRTTQGADLGPPRPGFKPWDFETVPEHRQPWVKSGLPPVEEPAALRTQGITERPAVPAPTEPVKVKYRDKNGKLRTKIVQRPIPISPDTEQAIRGREYEGKRFGGRTISGEIASGKLKFGETPSEDAMTGDFLGNDPFWSTIPDRLRPEPPNVTALRNLAEGTPKEGAPARGSKLNFIDEAEYLRQKEAAKAAEAKPPEPTRLPSTATKSTLSPSGEMEKIANKARFKGKSISDLAEMAKTADEPTANAIRDELARRRGEGGTTLSSIGLGEASRILRNEFNEWRVLKNLPENEAAFQRFLEETGKGAELARLGTGNKVDTSVVKEPVKQLPSVAPISGETGKVAKFENETPRQWQLQQRISKEFANRPRDEKTNSILTRLKNQARDNINSYHSVSQAELDVQEFSRAAENAKTLDESEFFRSLSVAAKNRAYELKQGLKVEPSARFKADKDKFMSDLFGSHIPNVELENPFLLEDMTLKELEARRPSTPEEANTINKEIARRKDILSKPGPSDIDMSMAEGAARGELEGYQPPGELSRTMDNIARRVDKLSPVQPIDEPITKWRKKITERVSKGKELSPEDTAQMIRETGLQETDVEDLHQSIAHELSQTVDTSVVKDPSFEEKGRVAQFPRSIKSILSKLDYLGFDSIREAKQAIMQHDDWATRWQVDDPQAVKEIGIWKSQQPPIEPSYWDRFKNVVKGQESKEKPKGQLFEAENKAMKESWNPDKFHVEIVGESGKTRTPIDAEFDTFAQAEAHAKKLKLDYNLKDARVIEPRLKGLSKPDKGTTLSAGGLGESVRILADVAGEVGGVFRKKFMKQNPALKTIMDKLIRRRASGDLIGKQVRDRFAKYGDLTTDKMVQLQNEMADGKHPDITKFFDDIYKELTDRGIELREKENYLPQIFKEKVKDIVSAFGSKTVSEKASFLLRSVIKDYAEGESKGLTPKLTPIELIEWYAKRANKLIADHEALKSLEKEGYVSRKVREKVEVTTKSGKVVTKQGKYIKPEGMVGLDTNLVPDGYYSSPEVKMILENYLKSSEEVSGKFWSKAEKVVGKVKNVMLSAGVPKVPALTFHGGNFARPFRGRAFREGGISGQYQALKYGFFPKLADKLLKEKAPAAIEATQRWGYSSTVERPTTTKLFEGENPGKFKRTANWLADKQYKYFEGPLFDKMLPALKWTVFERNFKTFIEKGMSTDAAGKAAVQISDDFMSGKNVDLLYHNKNFDSASRVFLLAPNWLRSSKDLAWKIPKSFIPFLKDFNSPISQKYRRAGARTLASYVAANFVQKAITGKFMVENKPADIMNLQLGDDPSDSKKSMALDWFGTAADDFEIPVKAIVAAMSDDERAKGMGEVLANTAEYRLSPLGQGILAGFMGENFQGEKNIFTTHDTFGNYIPTKDRWENTFSQIANFGPQQISQPINMMTGRASPFEGLTKMAESALVFRNKKKPTPRSLDIPMGGIKFPSR